MTSMAPADYLPPQNPDAEQAVLGAVLMDPDNIAVLGPMVRPDDFARLENADIWRAMLDLWRKRTPAADILLTDALKTSAAFQAAGGAAYLAELRAASWLGIYGEYYAELVAKLATKRRLIAASSKIVSLAWQPDTDPDQVLTEARRLLADAAPSMGDQSIKSFEHLADWLADEMDRRMDPTYEPDVVRTGLHDFDKAISGGGFKRQDLVILGARPGMGKTAMAMQWVKNYARHQVATNPDPEHVVVFSAEMSAEALMWRAATEHTHLTTDQLQNTRHLTPEQLDRVAAELRALRELPVLIDDRSAPTTDQMRLTVERLQARHPVRFVVFDYLGLGGDAHSEETHRYSKIADGLKTLAKSCDVTTVALAQLNRNVEHRAKGEKRPRLSDFNQSGKIEANADVALGLYWHDYYVRHGMEDPNDDLHNVAELIVLKQRDGTTPVVRVQFTPETVSFHSLAKG